MPPLFTYFKINANYGSEIANSITIWYPVFNLLTTIIFIGKAVLNSTLYSIIKSHIGNIVCNTIRYQNITNGERVL
jgi:hypothetical protein